MTFDERLDAREARRIKAEARASDRMDKQFDAAEPMIGELCREGKTVYYVTPPGGRYREAATRLDLIRFLIRNRYV
ncbi:MAG: hypothetical protein ACOYB0_08310 [Polynucleobacter sp.]